ncbi:MULTISPECIES: diphosphomevalonate/mevalonate 3,5-bisphosphate decarboxylase family protein [unclassified Polaribacter]|uniref:diphosphomevalonate/mevalonate 3,5-bisphosphate decarboxylase family protein n=1 Tax=unclassified Polaribacter TaxID=196858 RepID=UPI00052D62B5|nr:MULTISPECIES: diphosphomevalonate decarboxylase [unclassified Polaribacter]KGL61412.1 diphosphomevalonate decarboxylase [Polaribacter sp. Hel1_33_49]MBT3742249.1 diphosphomevalonate decarboxylase [Polaribacter sp.]MDG1194600.1 diphosphomevalonate decarboxylase [Polaribacter sp.]MDG1403593.1 diphosphomevalonate decarboxylase [Polaribacter sp.]
MNTDQFIAKSTLKFVETASFTWQTPSNIALVKYWGKSNPQIPKNASISFTLNNCHTITRVDFIKKEKSDEVVFNLFFEGKQKDEFKPKIAEFFKRVQSYCPYILEYEMTINSENSFPHSSGIASSASGLSAIAMCLMSLEKELNPNLSVDKIHKKASFLARLGSGSASRSIEGPLVVWGNHPEIEGSSDLFGIQFPYKVHPFFENYQDVILLVDKGEKQVSSTIGHNLMHKHPFAENRFLQANENLSKMSKILQEGNSKDFINLVESEALTLHAMMLTSNPYFILMKPNTLEIINKVWEYRQENNSNICFTLDAGANVHVLFPENEKENILQFIDNQISKYCQKNHYICDTVGFGAKRL